MEDDIGEPCRSVGRVSTRQAFLLAVVLTERLRVAVPCAARDGQTCVVFYSATPNELCKSSNGRLPSIAAIHYTHCHNSTLKQHLETKLKYVCFYRLCDPNVARHFLRLPGVALKRHGSLHTSFIGRFVRCTQKQEVRGTGNGTIHQPQSYAVSLLNQRTV
jgi:hypothetical protein